MTRRRRRPGRRRPTVPTGASSSGPSSGRRAARIVVAVPSGSTTTVVAGAEGPAADHAGVAAPAAGVAEHPLDRAAAPRVPRAPCAAAQPPAGAASSASSTVGPVVPGRGVGAVDHVVAVERRDRDHGARGDPEAPGQRVRSRPRRARRRRAVPADQVHLVGHDEELVARPSSAAMQVWRRVCSRRPAVASTTHQGQVGGRGAGGHVPRVLHVPGAVGDDELAVGRRRVAVGDVDGDALLALGPQAVGDEGEVDLAHARGVPTPPRRPRAGRRRAGGCRRGGGRSGSTCRRRPSRSSAKRRRSMSPWRARRPAASRQVVTPRSTPRACGPPSRSRRTGRRPGSRPARRPGRRRPRR